MRWRRGRRSLTNRLPSFAPARRGGNQFHQQEIDHYSFYIRYLGLSTKKTGAVLQEVETIINGRMMQSLAALFVCGFILQVKTSFLWHLVTLHCVTWEEIWHQKVHCGPAYLSTSKDLCVTSPHLYMGHWRWCWFWPGLQLRWWPPRHHWQPGLLASSLYTPLACWIFCPLTFWALSQYTAVTTGNLPCCISRHKKKN